MTAPNPATSDAPGLAARRIAADIVDGVLRRKRPLDEQLESTALNTLEERDRALVRQLAATVLRRRGTLRHLLGALTEKGLPKDAPRVESALLIGAAQIMFLDVPDHAAVDLSVRLAQEDRKAARYANLINAVLRRLGREGKRRLSEADSALLDTPDWLMKRWIAHYGESVARDIATANAQEPALDHSPRRDDQRERPTAHDHRHVEALRRRAGAQAARDGEGEA